MARRRGERIGQRWEVLEELSGTSELRRYRLRDLETNAPMDLWEPRASVLLRPGAHQALSAASAASPTAEGALPRFWIPTEQGSVCITPPTDGTLADRHLAFSPQQALDLARWLGPAILDPRGVQRDRVRPEDVVIDAEGAPRLLGLGLPPAEAVLEIPHHTAPEVLRRRGAQTASGLYGLGVILFKALTGAWPVPARNLQDLLARGSTPLRPSALRSDLTPDVDVLVQGLLSPDGAQRIEALRALGPWSGPPPTLALERVASSSEAAPVRAGTAMVPTSAAPPAQQAGGHLVIAEVRDLAPSTRFLVAALAGLDAAAMERAAGRHQGVVVAALRTAADARHMTEQLGAHGIPARVATSLGSGRGLLGFLALAALVTAAGAVLVSPILALALAAVGFFLAIIAFSRPAAALRGGPAPRHTEIQEAAALQRRVDALAVRLVDTILPTPVAADLRDDLHHLHQRVAELSTSRSGLTRALRAIDHAEASEPLRRSVAAIDREFDEMGDVLDDVEAMLATRFGDEGAGAGDAVGRINQRLTALRAASSELTAPDENKRRRAAAAQRQKQG
ncbi:MAG: hypothetical protein ABIO70_25290 [Pseudomonadota bacterium]